MIEAVNEEEKSRFWEKYEKVQADVQELAKQFMKGSTQRLKAKVDQLLAMHEAIVKYDLYDEEPYL